MKGHLYIICSMMVILIRRSAKGYSKDASFTSPLPSLYEKAKKDEVVNKKFESMMDHGHKIYRPILTTTTPKPEPVDVILPVRTFHTATFIFLHGRGDTAESVKVPLQQFQQGYVKVIAPNAPNLTIRAWYDINHDQKKTEDVEGINKATAFVHRLIDKQLNTTDVPAYRIVLGGFTQGAALALHAALTYPEKLGGVIMFSHFWPDIKLTAKGSKLIKEVNRRIPVFRLENEQDPEVTWPMDEKYKFTSFSGAQHVILPDELAELNDFFLTLPRIDYDYNELRSRYGDNF